MSKVSQFERNISVRRDGDANFSLDFDESFLGAGGLFGGIGLAASLNAALAEVGNPLFRVRSASTVFVSPVPQGRLSARTKILRVGGSIAQASITLQDEESDVIMKTIAVLGRDRKGFSFTDRSMPDVPDPQSCVSLKNAPSKDIAKPPFAAAPMWDAIERRNALGHSWWERDWAPDSSSGAMWLRFVEPPFQEDGTLNPLASIALTDMAGQSISEQVGPDAPEWAMVSLDHSVHQFKPAQSEWLLVSYQSNRAEDGFVSVNIEVWDQKCELVATATQIALIMFL